MTPTPRPSRGRDPHCDKDWKRASKGGGGWRDRGAGPWFKNHYCNTTHASTHSDMHARIGSHLRVSLRTIRCVICYSTGVRQVRPETVMAIRISSAEVGSESSNNLKKSTPSRPTLSPEPPNELPRGQKNLPRSSSDAPTRSQNPPNRARRPPGRPKERSKRRPALPSGTSGELPGLQKTYVFLKEN